MFRERLFNRAAALTAATFIIGLGSALAAEPKVRQVQIVAEKVCCNGCAQKVAAQLYTAPGVINVDADVSNHTVTVSLKPSSKVTLDQLWAAVEKGDGKPSKLITWEAIYTLKRPDELKLTEPLAANRFWVVVRNEPTSDIAQKIAKHLYAVRGVAAVRINLAARTFFVEAAADHAVSPWQLTSAVESAGSRAESITGPHGLLTVDHPTDRSNRAANNPAAGVNQGAVR
jgi:copper chaperone CopZ